MYGVDIYGRVRRACLVEGLSRREAARQFGIDRRTVEKMLRHSVPPGYRRTKPVRRPKLGPFVGVIDRVLEEDEGVPKKQRHSAKRIFERLRDEYGYTGGLTVVKDYVRQRRRRMREMFVPLSHPPGDAQADFGEAVAIIGGVEQRVRIFVMDLPHSDDGFAMAFPAETTEAFCEGHNKAFAHFGGVPRQILYDNTKLAVSRILGDGQRQTTRAFLELQSHYLFTPRYGRPGKGNDKGKVEGLIGYVRRNFFVPIPRFGSFEELSSWLGEQCLRRRGKRLRGHQETIGERFERDREVLLSLPSKPYEACVKVPTTVRSTSLVRFRNNDYSVPVAYGYRDAVVKGYVHEVVICCGTEVIARHRRSYGKEEVVYEPLHYLALLEQKANALDQAAPLEGWELPEEFEQLRRLLEGRMGKAGKREYIQVLRLLETFDLAEVRIAVREALHLGAISYDAVKHLILCRIGRKPPRLSLEDYPYLPRALVETTSAQSYMELLVGAGS